MIGTLEDFRSLLTKAGLRPAEPTPIVVQDTLDLFQTDPPPRRSYVAPQTTRPRIWKNSRAQQELSGGGADE